ncbi:helix-turn-helix domain-containing protein [Raineyella sp. LH-20]|uniref:helix-turn-helix domain-containing protein n=1 Tax=Raineyella sp. LH-20 TaxID=3081204 RepID=UPI0029531CCA|nr:helix-turn-helix domain-containing protein [Raineyella sp. LH-20]WOP17682.1 helix-turn-helix domain-containing protein [Raineyella sp. LH-20]
MTDDVTLVREAAGDDPGRGLRAVRSLRVLADRLEALQVARARRLGWSWQDIADELGVSRQAAHKKHGRHDV